MKKFATLTLAVLMVLTLLAGCGSSNMAADKFAPMEESMIESPAAPAPEYALDTGFKDMTSVAGQSVPNTEQKLIKTVRMDVETEDLDALLPQINEKIASLGGYVENQELYNGSSLYVLRELNWKIS